MRVTELGMMNRAATAIADAQSAHAEAAQAMSSGVGVTRASEDTVAWSTAARAQLRGDAATGRQSAIDRATTQVSTVDRALGEIGDAVASARALAIQGGNDTYSASERASLAAQVDAITQAAIGSANTRDLDGNYLLGGSLAATAPFDATGVYGGDAQGRALEVGEGQSLTLTVTGADLTVAGGVDVFQALTTLKTALSANNGAGIRASITNLGAAVDQLAAARGRVGAQLSTLQSATSARQDLSVALERIKTGAVAVDAVEGATKLQQTQYAFAAAQAVASQLASMFKQG